MPRQPKRRMGRPPKPPEEVRDQFLTLRLTREERRVLEEAAQKAEQPLVAMVREAAIEYAAQPDRKPRRKRREEKA